MLCGVSVSIMVRYDVLPVYIFRSTTCLVHAQIWVRLHSADGGLKPEKVSSEFLVTRCRGCFFFFPVTNYGFAKRRTESQCCLRNVWRHDYYIIYIYILDILDIDI